MITLLLLTPFALADGSEPTAGWEPDHPVQIGVMAGYWAGDHAAPGIGGDLAVRPVEAFGVDLFWNSFASMDEQWLWHDHVIGFSLYAPSLAGNRRFFVSPTLGSCVDFRFQSPLSRDVPAASDLAFGTHAGGMLEVWLGGALSLDVEAFGTWYVDNGVNAADWQVDTGQGLRGHGVFQATVGLAATL